MLVPSVWIGQLRNDLSSVIHSNQKGLIEAALGQLFDLRTGLRPNHSRSNTGELYDVEREPPSGQLLLFVPEPSSRNVTIKRIRLNDNQERGREFLRSYRAFGEANITRSRFIECWSRFGR